MSIKHLVKLVIFCTALQRCKQFFFLSDMGADRVASSARNIKFLSDPYYIPKNTEIC